jgi:hypothetical protein
LSGKIPFQVELVRERNGFLGAIFDAEQTALASFLIDFDTSFHKATPPGKIENNGNPTLHRRACQNILSVA